MSKPQYSWWGYVKRVVEGYPARCCAAEREAVEKARAATQEPEVERLIAWVYWEKRGNLTEAGAALGLDRQAVRRGHGVFLRRVAREMGLL
ncbi:MAG: hypothetical protein PHO10_03025 [Gemmiger sp.]|nr:hypothetical protein [Gemmiger sp.]